MTEEEEFEFRLRLEKERGMETGPYRDPRYNYNEDGTVAGIKPEAAPTKEEAREWGAGAGKTLFQEQMGSFGDEISGAVRGGLDYAMDALIDNPLEGDPTVSQDTPEFGDRYRMYRDDHRQATEDFAEANPKTALGLSVGGAALAPVPALRGAGIPTQLGKTLAEGALWGAGAADELEDVPRALFEGAKGAAEVGVPLAALSLGARGLTSRKVAEELQQADGTFKPLNLAEDSGNIGKVFQQTVAHSPIGGAKVTAMEKPWVDKAVARLDKAIAKERGVKAKVKAGKKVDTPEMKQIRDDALQEQAIISLPEHAPAKLHNMADKSTDGRKVNKAFTKWWDKEAFKAVKKRSFEVDDDLLEELAKKYPESDIMERMQKKMSGKALIDLRNEYAMAANRGSEATGKAAMNAGQQRKLATDIDNWLRSKLDGDELAKFNDEIDTYGEFKALQESVIKSKRNVYDPAKLEVTGKGKKKRGFGEAPGMEVGEHYAQKMDQAKINKMLADDETLNAAADALDVSKAELRAFSKKLTPENTSFLSDALMQRWVGETITPNQAGKLGQALAGTAMLTGAGTKSGQKFLAGQTGWQKAAQDEEFLMLLEALRAGLRREGAAGAQ